MALVPIRYVIKDKTSGVYEFGKEVVEICSYLRSLIDL